MSAGEGLAKRRGISPESILVPVNIDPLFRGVKKKERRREGEEGIVTMVWRWFAISKNLPIRFDSAFKRAV